MKFRFLGFKYHQALSFLLIHSLQQSPSCAVFAADGFISGLLFLLRFLWVTISYYQNPSIWVHLPASTGSKDMSDQKFAV